MALHWAAERGQGACLRALLERGASVEAFSSSGLTALHCAANQGCVSCCCLQTLLDAGSSLEATSSTGRTALHWAADRGYAACLRALLGAGARPGAVDCDGQTALHLAQVAEGVQPGPASAHRPEADQKDMAAAHLTSSGTPFQQQR